MTDNCERCKFFTQANATQGLCRRNPPTPFPVGPEESMSYWPAVQVQHWCGEYKAGLVLASSLPPDALPRRLAH